MAIGRMMVITIRDHHINQSFDQKTCVHLEVLNNIYGIVDQEHIGYQIPKEEVHSEHSVTQLLLIQQHHAIINGISVALILMYMLHQVHVLRGIVMD